MGGTVPWPEAVPRGSANPSELRLAPARANLVLGVTHTHAHAVPLHPTHAKLPELRSAAGCLPERWVTAGRGATQSTVFRTEESFGEAVPEFPISDALKGPDFQNMRHWQIRSFLSLANRPGFEAFQALQMLPCLCFTDTPVPILVCPQKSQ